MKVIISRTYNPNETLSCLLVLDGKMVVFTCKAIELPSNGNQHDVSCIPEGMYWVIKTKSSNGENVFLLLDVPDRDGIEMHAGNFATGKKIDTDGCILPGIGFEDIDGNGTMDVFDSKRTMERLWDTLPDKFILIIC